jgi:hypothetical protein
LESGIRDPVPVSGKNLFRIQGQTDRQKVALHDQLHLVAVPGVEHLLHAEEETLFHVARTGGVLPAAPAAQGVAARYRGRRGGRMEERWWTDVFRLRRGRVSGALAASSLRINYKSIYRWRMRSSRVVRASDRQCRSRKCPGFDPSILRHSGK